MVMPTTQDSLKALREAFPRLAERAGAHLDRLAADLVRHEPEAGTVLLHDHSPQDSLFLICRGEVRVELDNGDERVRVGTLGKSKWFGEIGFLEGGTSTAAVIVTQPSLVLSVSRAQFLRYLDEEPVLADALLSEVVPAMTRRLRETREIVDRGDLALGNAEPQAESLFARALHAVFGGGG